MSMPSVKPELAVTVKSDLAVINLPVASIGVMFDESYNFTPEHLRGMGQRMEQAIRMARKTKAEVAGLMEVSRAAMTQYCKGESVPTLQRMTHFCRIVRSPIDFIVTGATTELEDLVLPVLNEMIEGRKRKAQESDESLRRKLEPVAREIVEEALSGDGKRRPARMKADKTEALLTQAILDGVDSAEALRLYATGSRTRKVLAA